MSMHPSLKVRKFPRRVKVRKTKVRPVQARVRAIEPERMHIGGISQLSMMELWQRDYNR